MRSKEKLKKYKNLSKAKYLFLFLRLIVIIVMIINIFNGNYENVFVCLLTLILFILPYFIEKKFKLEIPDTLEIIILLFIFSAEILGELNSFYTRIPGWDSMLHTINGFIMGAIGLSMIDILNSSRNTKIKLSPIFVAIVSFCFSMTIGVLWEFFEFGMDSIFKIDMQKDYVINEIHSVTFDPNGRNSVHDVYIDSLMVNGEDYIEKYGGYIDIGLIDTMKDLIVNFIGAFVFAVFGYFYNKENNNDKIKKILIVAN